MDIQERIETDPAKMQGKPVIKGTRITVELIIKKLSEGTTEDQLLEAYPNLTSEDVRAALAYASRVLSFDTTVE